MITINIIYKFLQAQGYNVQPSVMGDHIDKWAQWRQGKVTSFHSYQVYNGEKYIQCERQSLQLPKSVCETWANMLFNERCLISVDGENITRDAKLESRTAQYVKDIFDRNNLWARINEAQELKCAYGTIAYIPRIKSVNITADNRIVGGGTPLIDIIPANRIIPISHENGTITELAIYSKKTVKGNDYAYIQLFVIENGLYVIKNALIRLIDDKHYEAVNDITTISGYERTARKFETKSDVKPFVIDRPNITNNIEQDSPFGISVYANAIDSIKACDIVFDSLTTEFSLGRTRLFAAPTMMLNQKGEPIFDPKDVIFQFMGTAPLSGDTDSVNKLIETIQPLLRIGEHQQGLQTALSMFSAQCGLGENYYRFEGGSIATATQVISEQSTAYRTKSKHEIILEAALYDLVMLIVDVGIKTLNIKDLNPTPEIKIKFDDSIIEDKTSMRKQDLLDVSQGAMNLWEYRVKWYGETEEQAKAALDIDDGLLTEPTNFRELATPTAGRLEQKISAAIPQ